MLSTPLLLAALSPALASAPSSGQDRPALALTDVFDLELAAAPRISPDGTRVVYERTFFDVMTDRRRTNLWSVDVDGGDHRPLTTGLENDGSPRWSPDGTRLAYVSRTDGTAQIWVRWLDDGARARVTNLQEGPGQLAWSPDGRWLAFTMFVPDAVEPFVELPAKPEGATWAPPARVIQDVHYRSDGAGYLEPGHRHVFVVPADGGTPRQLTQGSFDHGASLGWTPDGRSLVFSANRREDADYEPQDSELWSVDVESGTLTQLTDRRGPDGSPAVSPPGAAGGARVLYTGFDDRRQGYQVTRLYVLDLASGQTRTLTENLDRSVDSPRWSADGTQAYFLFDDHGDTRLGRVPVAGGDVELLASGVGGLSLGRPYPGGSFSVARDGRIAFTQVTPTRPSDVAVLDTRHLDVPARRLTALNDDLLGHRALAALEEHTVASSHDGLTVQYWVALPPGFDPARRYPLLLEIHGGPFADYGPRFAAEIQLYAAAGYVVLYANPRGSTSYGERFGNAIHHAYPGFDYDDLMSCVDDELARGRVDPARLFVTGGSGGGVLTSWIVGKTDRFRAAVVAKPVIDWTSFVLTADAYPFFTSYWFPALPWEDPDHYWARSPLSLVGNVTTPTMLMTGEADYRTPISESEQFYQALKLRRIETALVRIPEASHGITARPSHLIAKVAHVLEWFRRHDQGSGD